MYICITCIHNSRKIVGKYDTGVRIDRYIYAYTKIKFLTIALMDKITLELKCYHKFTCFQ